MSFVSCHICAEDNIPAHFFKNYLCDHQNHQSCTTCSWNWFKQKLDPFMETLDEKDKDWSCFFCRSVTTREHQIKELIDDASHQGLITEKEKTSYLIMTEIAYAKPVPTNFRRRLFTVEYRNPIVRIVMSLFLLTVFIGAAIVIVVSKVVSAVNRWLSRQTGLEPKIILTIELNLMLVPLYMKMM